MFTDMGAEELRRSLELATKQAEYQLDRQMDCHPIIFTLWLRMRRGERKRG